MLLNIFYCVILGFLTLDPRNDLLSTIGIVIISILYGFVINNYYKYPLRNKIFYFGFFPILYLSSALFFVGFDNLANNGFLISVLCLIFTLSLFNQTKHNLKDI